ncbi:LacI family DNA-binding transcriptional regulator [Oribacterium sp. WCC10]|uniref:LacI family DNA-binding transcriptional regulator n=1 Tax=Oribacterium sp. WCC10 TaxID=1855343 RepID=UPI0008EB9D35|nr:LacI family DNA-binding transcriptional regulator [Oribacterium sp. WCC10]SFG14400.1 transcriptional regulator, LacI family [Oribacterium sp. WCC10]
MATTLKDVAKEAGLAVETVSRVLNNRGYISEKTRKKVNDAMQKIGYRPNIVARTLSKGRSDAIAVIVPHMVHPYFSQMLSEIEQYAAEKQYQIFISNSTGDLQKETSILELCENSLVAGVLIFSRRVKPEILKKFNLPIITIERFIEGGTGCVLCDNYKGGQLAAEELIKKGCKNLLMLGSVWQSKMPADVREDGFMDVCRKNGVNAKVLTSNAFEYEEMEYHESIRKALNEFPDTDGIFCSSDLIAAQVLQVASMIGKKVPEDLKIIGFDDTQLSRLTTPQLTTIHQPIREMARLSLDMIFDTLENKEVTERNVLDVNLVVRGTT